MEKRERGKRLVKSGIKNYVQAWTGFISSFFWLLAVIIACRFSPDKESQSDEKAKWKMEIYFEIQPTYKRWTIREWREEGKKGEVKIHENSFLFPVENETPKNYKNLAEFNISGLMILRRSETRRKKWNVYVQEEGTTKQIVKFCADSNLSVRD